MRELKYLLNPTTKVVLHAKPAADVMDCIVEGLAVSIEENCPVTVFHNSNRFYIDHITICKNIYYNGNN